MSPIKSLSIVIALILSVFYLGMPQSAQASSKPLYSLAGDAQFVDVDALNTDQIQDILDDNGGFLKDFEEGGRSAAQIIHDAAHGYGDASGELYDIDIDETINPAAILAVLQKEQSLVTMKSRHDGALNAAMGYGCPDSGGCNEKYRGFTKQVENGAWQLRYNYERADGNGFSTYQVGDKVTIDGNKVVIANRATSALYRYTPHMGTNFTTLFGKYNPGGSGAGVVGGTIYDAKYSKSKPKSKKLVLNPGESTRLEIYYKNTGDITWSNSGANPVRLGTQDPQDGVNQLIGTNRINMATATVKDGKKATFVTTIKAPNAPGTYNLKFRPLAEGKQWFGDTAVITLTVNGAAGSTVAAQGGSYNAQLSKVKPDAELDLAKGETATLSFKYKNTGTADWDGSVKLGSREGNVLLGGGNRVNLSGSLVKAGKKAVFAGTITAPQTAGTYTLVLQPVAGDTWFGTTTTVTVTVR